MAKLFVLFYCFLMLLSRTTTTSAFRLNKNWTRHIQNRFFPNSTRTTTMAASTTTAAADESTKEIPRFYPIGTPGKAWNDAEREQWKAQTKLHRSYETEVLTKINALKETFDVEQYGALSHNPERYPLFAIKSKNWSAEKPSLLVTGGVHGYETSGVQGALLFLKEKASSYVETFNILVAPCVSPWAYEHIQRWQADIKDPNRSFKEDESLQTEESKALMAFLKKQSVKEDTWTCHLDLHETTDTDATEFMPAKHAEAGLAYESEVIPDGFYLVGDSLNPQLDFQKAVIAAVKKVTHIAPPDGNGNIIDEEVVCDGVIIVPAKQLGLCCSVTGGTYVSTTEVYPDSPKVTDDDCNLAQVAAITGALDHIIEVSKKE